MPRFRHHPLIGTFVDIRLPDDTDDDTAELIDALVVTEMERCERIFSIFDPTSELSRWRRGESAATSPALTELLALGLRWQHDTEGYFNTASRALTARWQQAEESGRPPQPAELVELASSIATPRYRIDNGRAVPIGNLNDIDLNALAKGWIVDQAAELAHHQFPDRTLVVDAGGDMRYFGTVPIVIGIENPLRPYDNEPPIAHLELSSGGLATSGGSRRGFNVGGVHYPHLIDPHTGLPTTRHASVTITAPDTATADVVATVCGLLGVTDALDLATRHDCGCLIVTADGGLLWNDHGRPLT